MSPAPIDMKMTKANRKQPYALYFFLLSALIIAASFWVMWFEFIKLRPWRSYQKQYYQLKHLQLEREYDELLTVLNSPEVQREWAEWTSLLQKFEEDFERPDVQAEYSKVSRNLDSLRTLMKRNRASFRKARGLFLEHEFLFYKYQKEEDKALLVALESEIEVIEEDYRGLGAQRDTLIEQRIVFTSEIESLTAELQSLKAPTEQARDRIERLAQVPVEIKQVYMPDINKADRCQSCHIGIDSPDRLSEQNPFSSHPAPFIYLENHPPAEFGCTFCHRGQGRATSSHEKAHGWVEHWLEPMLVGSMTQATCEGCHGAIQNLRGAELIAEGSAIVERRGCYGCHKIAGYDGLRKVGPDLTAVGTKVNYTWLVEWIKDPKNYLTEARMPNFYFSQSEAEAIADYLFSMTRRMRTDELPPEIDWDLADRGKAVWRNSRCSICHAVDGVGGTHKKAYAPDLGKVGSKVNGGWLLDWIKDPKDYFPLTKMPRFRFTPEERRALAEYIRSEYVDWDFEAAYAEPIPIEVSSIQRGKALIQNYGCFGCHDVKGMEEMERIGPYLRQEEVAYLKVAEVDEKIGAELTSIGSKATEQLDFGRLAKELPPDRVSYLKHKLKEPRSFRDKLRMPNFRFSDENIDALVTLLVGFTDAAVPTRFKLPSADVDYEPTGAFAKIVDDVKCLTCHTIRGNGADYAPDLSIEGSKVQEPWLREFLVQPDIIRPMLQQMPLFNLGHERQMIQGNLTYTEIETIVQYIKLVLVSNDIPEVLPENGLARPEQIAAGKMLYETKGCRSCHQIGVDGGSVGPGLTNVGNRLTAGYVYTHLENPQALDPDIIEPNYGFAEHELINLTRYLMSLKKEELP